MQSPFGESGLFEPGSQQVEAIEKYLFDHGSRMLGTIRFNMEGEASDHADPNGAPGYSSRGTDPMYGYDLAENLADDDRGDQLVLAFYGMLAHSVTRGTDVGGEGNTVGPVPGEYYRQMNNPPNSVTAAAILNHLRLMLVHETTVGGQVDGLQLAHSTPRGWLEPGKRIAVTDAPTDFGPVSYTLDAVSADRADATVDVPPRLGAGDEF